MIGWRDANEAPIPKGNRHHILLFEPLLFITNSRLSGRDLLEGLRIHKVPLFTIVVEILHIGIHHIGRFNALPRFKGFLYNTAGDQVANLDPVKGLPLAGLYNLVLNDGTWRVIHHKFKTTFKLIGADTSHFDRFLAKLGYESTYHTAFPLWEE